MFISNINKLKYQQIIKNCAVGIEPTHSIRKNDNLPLIYAQKQKVINKIILYF